MVKIEMGIKIAVTVDDLPFARINSLSLSDVLISTQRLLVSFAQYAVPAVGFVNSQQLERSGVVQADRVAILQSWLSAGYELGNHTYSHPSANQVSVEFYADDIIKGEPIIRELLNQQGRPLRYFRHPFLRTGITPEDRSKIESFLNSRRYIVAPVTFDNSDWQFAAAYSNAIRSGEIELAERVGEAYLVYMQECSGYWRELSQKLFGREIAQTLLIHANQLNADYGDRLWRQFIDQGYEFVSLDEALTDAAYKSADRYVGERGLSWLIRWAISRGGGVEEIKLDPMVPEWVVSLGERDVRSG